MCQESLFCLSSQTIGPLTKELAVDSRVRQFLAFALLRVAQYHLFHTDKS